MKNKIITSTGFVEKNQSYELIKNEKNEFLWVSYDGVEQKIVGESVKINGCTYLPPVEKVPANLNLATGLGTFKSPSELMEEITGYLEKCIFWSSKTDLLMASLFVKASYVSDQYESIPMLMVHGHPGTGKTKVLKELFKISYLSRLSSGLDSDAAIARQIDQFQGTFLCDETQKSASNFNDIFHKMLTLGTSNGSVWSKCDGRKSGGYENVALKIYGPKVFAGRHLNYDSAITQRSHVIEMKLVPNDVVKIIIDENKLDQKQFDGQAKSIANDLLLYRQRRKLNTESLLNKHDVTQFFKDQDTTLREMQMMLCFATEATNQDHLAAIAEAINKQRSRSSEDINLEIDVQILLEAKELFEEKRKYKNIALKEISDRLNLKQGTKYTPRDVSIRFKNFGLATRRKSEGTVLACDLNEILETLKSKGYVERVDLESDVDDVI